MALELCRICGNNQNLTSIFEKGPEMLEKLKCASIVIKTDDILPKLICQQCDRTLDMSYLLRKQSEAMEQRLQVELQKKQAVELQKQVVGNEEDIQYISDEDLEFFKEDCNVQNREFRQNNVNEEQITITDTGGSMAEEFVLVEPDIFDTVDSESTLVASETEGPTARFKNVAESNVSYSFKVFGSSRPPISEFVDDIASNGNYNGTNSTRNIPGAYNENEELDVGYKDFLHSDSSSNLLQPQVVMSCSASPTPADNDTEYYPRPGTLPYTCITCHEVFAKKKEYKEHIAQHGPNRYQCIQCLAAFPTRYRLIRHEAIHTDGAAYKCTECNRQYRMAYNLQRHILSCHSDKAKYQCHICCLNYTRSDVLKRHIAQVHCNNKKWHCKGCGMSFRSPCFLNEHKSQQICNSKPPTKKVPNIATANIPSEYILIGPDNKYKCVFCNMKFKTISNCRTHLMIHNNIKPFPCTICPKSFRTRYALTNHERIHNNERPFQCDICSKAFRQITHLKHHRMLHTKDNMVKCPECQAGFVTKWKLREHLRREHYTMKAFKCAECPEEFFLKYDLKRHAKLVHLRSVSTADSDNEGVKNSTYVPEVTSDSERSVHVDHIQEFGEEEHYNDVDTAEGSEEIPDQSEDVIDILEDTDQEADDDYVNIIEDDNEDDNIDLSKEPEQVISNETTSKNMDMDANADMFVFNDVEDVDIADYPNNDANEPDKISTEPTIDCINLDSSNSCKSPPSAPHPASDNEYFDNIIEQEEEIHITEEKIEMFTTFYDIADTETEA